MLSHSIGLSGLIGFGRRAPALSFTGIQKSHFLSTSQSYGFGSKERLLLPQNYSIIESNVLKQPIRGLRYRAFSAEDSKKERIKAAFVRAFENEKWTLVVGSPPGMHLQSIFSKVKLLYQFTSSLIIFFATCSYATGYISFNYCLAVNYGSLLIGPLSLYVFSRFSTPVTAYILIEKNDNNILIGHVSPFFKHKRNVIPINDITSDKAAVKTGRNIQGLILSRKSNPNEWFYLPSNGIIIFDKKKAERIFKNLNVFSQYF